MLLNDPSHSSAFPVVRTIQKDALPWSYLLSLFGVLLVVSVSDRSFLGLLSEPQRLLVQFNWLSARIIVVIGR